MAALRLSNRAFLQAWYVAYSREYITPLQYLTEREYIVDSTALSTQTFKLTPAK